LLELLRLPNLLFFRWCTRHVWCSLFAGFVQIVVDCFSTYI